jgi:hypothetical protein
LPAQPNSGYFNRFQKAHFGGLFAWLFLIPFILSDVLPLAGSYGLSSAELLPCRSARTALLLRHAAWAVQQKTQSLTGNWRDVEMRQHFKRLKKFAGPLA